MHAVPPALPLNCDDASAGPVVMPASEPFQVCGAAPAPSNDETLVAAASVMLVLVPVACQLERSGGVALPVRPPSSSASCMVEDAVLSVTSTACEPVPGTSNEYTASLPAS